MINIHELYNFQNDILDDMPPQDGVDTRHAMWGLMPYSVSDGPGVINEGFISFVLNRNKYPTSKLPSAPYLTERFHECVNNLSEVLEHVSDKKKFYNNLLELQDYLIRGKFWDKEPLQKESIQLNEEGMPNVVASELQREVSDSIANEFAAKMNLGVPQYMGGGGYGYAYQINNNRVLKITTDACEVDAGGKIHQAKPKTLAYVFNMYKVFDSEKNITVYALIEEYIADKPNEEFLRYKEIINALDSTGEQGLYTKLLDILVRGKQKHLNLLVKL